MQLELSYAPEDGGRAAGVPLLAKEHAIRFGRCARSLCWQQFEALSCLSDDLRRAGGGSGRLVEGRELPAPAARGGE